MYKIRVIRPCVEIHGYVYFKSLKEAVAQIRACFSQVRRAQLSWREDGATDVACFRVRDNSGWHTAIIKDCGE